MLGPLDQEQAPIALHDGVNDDVPERRDRTVLERAGDHSILTRSSIAAARGPVITGGERSGNPLHTVTGP